MIVCLKKTGCTLLSITHYTLYIQTLAVIPKTLKIFGGKSKEIYLIFTANMSNYTFIWPISMWRLMKDQTDDMFLQFLKDAAKYYKGQVSNCFSS